MILVNFGTKVGIRVMGKRLAPMLAFGVTTLTDDDKIRLEKGEKCRGSDQFGCGPDEGGEISARAWSGIYVSGDLAFDQRKAKGRKIFKILRTVSGKRAGVNFHPAESRTGKYGRKRLRPFREEQVHSVSYTTTGPHDEIEVEPMA